VTVALTGVLGAIVADRRVGLVAAGLLAASPLMIAADGALMAEPVYVCLITAALIAAYRAIAAPVLARFAVLGLLLGLSALARSDGLIVAPVLIGATAWAAARPVGWRAGAAVLSLALVVATLAPWAVRNTMQMDEPVLLTSNSGSLLEGANCPGAYRGRLLGGWDASCLVETRRPGTEEATWAAEARSAGVRYARDNAGRVPVVAAARGVRVWGLWNPVGQVDDLEVIESRTPGWQLAGWAYASGVIVAAVPGVVLLRRRRAELAPLVAMVAAVTVVAIVSWGNQRFRLPAEPAVAVAAAVAVVSAATGGSRSRD
jgi:hypothetical protein